MPVTWGSEHRTTALLSNFLFSTEHKQKSQYHYFGSSGITCILKPSLTVNDSDWQFSGSLALVFI